MNMSLEKYIKTTFLCLDTELIRYFNHYALISKWSIALFILFLNF